ncbi:MAG TPA: PfkB family carbohydrate kinase [Candidatus Limnocylindrales bacterium]|nr:PfkB family carbohydrate kinase [Candidatus Limnocylindrales bacterium]
MSTATVVCIGVATLDAIVELDRLPGRDERVSASDGRLAGGGVAATSAVTLARLGVPAAIVGRVGNDAAGRWIRDDLAGAGVDVGGLRHGPGRSPVSVVLVERGSGGRALAPYGGDNGPIELDDTDLERCRAAAWVHVDHFGVDVARALRAAGVATPISFDGGVDVPGLDLGAIDLYAPTEVALLARLPGLGLAEAMAAALAEGPSTVVVTRGADGSAALDRAAADVTFAGAFPIDADRGSTLGAGDVFHGALLAGLVEGRSLPQALVRANACAGLACRAIDGRSAIPSAPELDAYLAAHAREVADARS